MKKPSRDQRAAGFTLVEMMITTVVFAITGGMIFIFLNSGMNLYAKNTAVNAAHQQARAGVDQMLANIHAAVSIPQLVDQNLTPLPPPGYGPSCRYRFSKIRFRPLSLVDGAKCSRHSELCGGLCARPRRIAEC